MYLLVVDSRSNEELLREHEWDGQLPRVGDIMELHSGPAQRWLVEEVDWVFQDSDPSIRDEVPLKYAMVRVCPESEAQDPYHRSERDPSCASCGHPQSVHTPIRCAGNASTCQCQGFTRG